MKSTSPNFVNLLVTALLFLRIISGENHVGSDGCLSLPKLLVLPGRGWCNLRNEEMGQVQQFTYQQCKTTPDGFFLIPDSAFIIPVSESKIELYAEIIDSWKNYSSINARSININGDASFGFFASVSGSFSEDYQICKKTQVDQNSVTTRVQARYTMYTVGVSVDDQIQPHLLSQLQKAMNALKAKNDEEVDYLLELIVREYGTHLLTRVDTGGVLYQEEYLSRSYRSEMSKSSEMIRVAASARFFSLYNFGASFSTIPNKTVMEGYENNIRSSRTKTYGGMLLRPIVNMTDGWVESLAHDPVGIDREGDPLHFIVTPSTFPDETLEMVDTLRLELQGAIGRYFSYNRHIGCMDVSARNFDYNANIDNDMCKDPFYNYTLGGVFQTCTNDMQWPNFCTDKNLEHKNILTQGFTCPTPYVKVALMTDTQYDCASCSFWYSLFHSCCSHYTVTTFWCAADETLIGNNTGLMFGGLYTSKMDNPTTQSKSCPPTFTAATMFNDLTICMGFDYELGSRYSIDFAGFFSCQIGNPMYNRKDLKKYMTLMETRVTLPDLHNQTTKSCPPGYTQHTATVISDCIINYCVKAGSFALHGEMAVVLPPFQNYTGIFSHRNPVNGGAISGWWIALIVVSSFVVLIALIMGIVMRVRRSDRGGNVEDGQGLLNDDQDEPVGDE